MPTPENIRAARLDQPKLRERDLSDQLGISEAQLLAAHCGQGVTRITADLERIMPQVEKFGDVMALTRNESCVIEKTGKYGTYRSGGHAGMILNEEIDLRMFPKNWVHGFAVEKTLDGGATRRSLQIFDAAGDAVHKIFLKDISDSAPWESVVAELRAADQDPSLTVSARQPVDPAKGDPEDAAKLRTAWDGLTDTHQFQPLMRKLKMNRLGAYRMAGAPYVRKLDTSAVSVLLEKVAGSGLPIMVFVGNMGCIEIHTGRFETLKPMGPWLNILDPRFNLHLRADHIAEVYQVTKSTRRGDAISVEAFGADGLLIAQFFGVLAEPEAAEKWNALLAELPGEKQVEPV